jgi:hypothetical protein
MNRRQSALASITGTVLLAWLAIAGAVSADPASVDTVQQLTGGTSRIWILEKTTVEMGVDPTKACKGGSIYRFAKDGATLTISECRLGEMVKSSHTWKLKQISPIDVLLVIDNAKEFTVRFKDENGHPRMRLRAETASKISPDTDLEFKLGAD